MVSFDPRDPRYAEEGVPFDALRTIRREHPLYRTPSGEWYVGRHADVEAALRDVEVFRADLGAMTGIPEGVGAIPDDQHYLSEIAEPRHGAIRRLFNAALGTHRVKEVEPAVAAECHRLVEAMVAMGTADLHADYAMAIPAFAMAHIMGFGTDAVAEFMRWSTDGTIMTRPCSPGSPPEGPASHPFFEARLAEERRHAEPTNHLFKVMVTAEVDGRLLTDREIVTQLHFMIQAGVHTTRSLLAHLMNRLVQDPALYADLGEDPGLIPRYIEESLRHDSPVQGTPRRVTGDVEIDGTLVRRGDWITMGIGSANRDEELYEDPDAFRLDREDPRRHLAFGAGPHICPGATLARLEGVTAVRVLIERVRELQPVEGTRYPPLPGSLGHQPIPARLVPR